MKVQVTTSAGLSTVSALLYAFPKKGNAPEGYTLTLNGKPTETRQTGGGKYPQYVYLMIDGVSHYLPKNVIPLSGTDVLVVKEEAKPVPAKVEEPAPEAAVEAKAEVEAPVPAKKVRVPKK